jgi:hypothetical protein
MVNVGGACEVIIIEEEMKFSPDSVPIVKEFRLIESDFYTISFTTNNKDIGNDTF